MGKFIEGNEVGKDTQFKPGESGNSAGLPKGYKTFKTRIQEIAEKEIDFTDLNNKKIKGSVGDGIIMALCAKALMGDVVAAKALMEHAEAKKIELSGDEEKPIAIKPDLSGLTNEQLQIMAAVTTKRPSGTTES